MEKDLYDVITKNVISGINSDIAKGVGVDPSNISKLRGGRHKSLCDRYCLLSRKEELIFKLRNVQTQEIYECLTLRTIFLHLKIQPTENLAKYVYELRKGRQEYASFGNFLISVENPTKEICGGTAKNAHLMSEQKKYQRLKIKISSRLRCRIRNVIFTRGSRKTDSTQRLIGCNIDFFMGYIEALFTEGMSWENYGRNGWHIDHIIPCNTFNMLKEEDQRKCFHYTNLRPLWEQDNLRRPKDGSDVL